MSRFVAVFVVVLSVLVAFVSGETIVSDIWGNSVTLPLTGGNPITGGFTVAGSPQMLSPYTLAISINDPVEPNPSTGGYFSSATQETFYLLGGTGAFCSGTLVNQTFQANSVGPLVQGNYINSIQSAIGTYYFTVTFPANTQACFNFTYNSTVPSDVDHIYVSVGNVPVAFSSSSSASSSSSTSVRIVGDPQFIGLRGQSYQVHGIDGAVYNIITETNTQVNARFVFLSQGQCPIINGAADSNCWSHPGSYLGEISFQQIVNGVNHQALISAGSAQQGFSSLVVDGKALKVGASVSFGSFSVNYTSAHSAVFTTEHFTFELSNSDMFINQAVATKVALKQLTAHGLLGQTHNNKVYTNALRYIEGTVDDYIIENDDIFGNQFPYNQFAA